MEEEFKQALLDASNWYKKLTEEERRTLLFKDAKQKSLDRIFQKYKNSITTKNKKNEQ